MPNSPWQWIQSDFMGELPRSKGHNAIYVVSNRLMKMAYFILMTTDISAATSGNREFEQKFDPLLSGQMSSNMSQEQKKFGRGSSYGAMWHYVALYSSMGPHSAT